MLLLYCKPKYSSDLTIIPIIAALRKTLLELNAVFLVALYVIYKLKKLPKILGVIIKNTADLSKTLQYFCRYNIWVYNSYLLLQLVLLL